MAGSIFNIGTSALNAAQAGLLTAGHNIANANTAGYSRQRIEQATNLPHYTGSGFYGAGVHVESVRRQYDALLAGELLAAKAQAAHSQAYSAQLLRIDGLLADPLSGLSPAIDAFFAGMHDVASRPSDHASRQNLVSSAQALAARFHELDGQLSGLRSSVSGRISSGIAEINSLASGIASLNKQILAAGAGDGRMPNDLMDQRDQLVSQLSEKLRVTVVTADNGDYSVFLGNGQALVLRDQAYQLQAQPDPLDSENLRIGLQAGGSFISFRTSDLSGGELGGLLAFRDETLGEAQNTLGRLAIALGEAFNAQHRLGVDRNGVAGGDFFAVGTPQVLTTSTAAVSAAVTDATQLTTSDYRLAYDGTNYTLTRATDGNVTTFAAFPQTVDGLTLSLAGPAPASGDAFLIRPTRGAAAALQVLVSDPMRVAAAAPIRTAAPTSNTGTGTISAGSVNASYLVAPLGAAVTLTYDAATGMLSGLPATPAFAYSAGTPVTWNGITFAISGALADGDSFTIAPNVNGIGDGRNAVALAGLQSSALVGGSTLQQAYGGLVSVVGNRARAWDVAAESQANLVIQGQAMREAVSGVNLDEEASDLLRYQQAYQAAGKLIGIAATLFDTLLGLGR